MGYSKSPGTAQKLLPELQGLFQGKTRVEWIKEDPDRFAYKIREAFYIAKHNRQMFSALAVAADQYTLHVERPNKIVARLRTDLVPLPTAPPIKGMLDRSVSFAMDGAITLERVVQTWIDAQPADVVILQDARISAEVLESVSEWAQKLNPAWILTQPAGTQDLVLTPEGR